MFNKLMVSYMATVLLLTALTASLYMGYYSYGLRQGYQETSNAAIQSVQSQIDIIAQNIDSLIMQLSLSENITDALSHPYNLSMLQYRDLKEDLRNRMSANSLLNSIYLYFRIGDKVLTTGEGLYDLNGFYDRDIVRQAAADTGGNKRIVLRELVDPYKSSRTAMITFIQPLPINAREPWGYLIVNVNRDEFMRVAQLGHSEVLVLDSRSYSVISDGSYPGLPDMMRAMLRSDPDAKSSSVSEVEIGQTRYFLAYNRQPGKPWILVSLLPASDYWAKVTGKLAEVLRICLVVLLIGVIPAYVFSRRMYRPWKQIVSAYFPAALASRSKDESLLVNESIRALIEENRSIRLTLEQSEPIIRHRLVYDILANSLFEAAAIETRLLEIGVAFPHPCYAALVVVSDLREYEGRDDYNRYKLLLFSMIENTLGKHLFLLGTILENNNFGFILNLGDVRYHDELKKRLRQLGDDINRIALDEWGVSLQFAFGNIYGKLSDIHASYTEAKRVVNCKALISETDVVFFQDIESDDGLDYPLQLQNELIRHVLACDREKASSALADLFRDYVHNMKYSRESVQETIIMLMSALRQRLFEEGFPVQQLRFRSGMVGESRNHIELKQLLDDHIREIIHQIESWKGNRNDNLYIAKAIQYMKTHYAEIESVQDIAAHVGLSSGYLTRMFRSKAGIPPLDMLTRIRIEASKELLKENNYKYSLQEICLRIGYRDVQSFIRFFKKLETVTPGEYRKMLLQQK